MSTKTKIIIASLSVALVLVLIAFSMVLVLTASNYAINNSISLNYDSSAIQHVTTTIYGYRATGVNGTPSRQYYKSLSSSPDIKNVSGITTGDISKSSIHLISLNLKNTEANKYYEVEVLLAKGAGKYIDLDVSVGNTSILTTYYKSTYSLGSAGSAFLVLNEDSSSSTGYSTTSGSMGLSVTYDVNGDITINSTNMNANAVYTANNTEGIRVKFYLSSTSVTYVNLVYKLSASAPNYTPAQFSGSIKVLASKIN